MKNRIIYIATVAVVTVAAVSCTGRTADNMVPLGETVDVAIDTVSVIPEFVDAESSVDVADDTI